MMAERRFDRASLCYDEEKEAERICRTIREHMVRSFRKKGLVVALSGGIDSGTVASLCVRALGKENVFGLLMPERESSAETLALSKRIADFLQITYAVEDITPVLEAVGCYRKRNDAIRKVIPEFGDDWKIKIVLPSVLTSDRFRLFSAVAQAPDGTVVERQLTHDAYLGILAASNFKQRIRKMLEYYHADRLNYAVTGTPNRLEYDQGFFVKLGDGAADIKPIAHLYKTQVFAMARYLGIPSEIIARKPSTDTYSLPQTQDEFYFSLPYDLMDICLYACNHHVPVKEAAEAAGLTEDVVVRVFRDIEQKRRATAYLHREPVLVETIDRGQDA